MVVVMMLGALTAIAIPLIDVARSRLDAGVAELATELISAQRTAVLKGHDVVVAVDPDGGFFRVHQDANNDGVIQAGEQIRLVHLGDGVVFGRTGAPKLSDSEQAVTFTKKQGSIPRVTFHRNGSASEQGYIYLTGYGGAALAKNCRAIEVVRATAKVAMWSYRSGSWEE
jgi:hypothetical protein